MHPSANRKNVEVPDRCTVTVGHRPIGWEEFLRNSSAGVFHDVRWGEFLGSAVGNKVWRLTARRNERICGVLQLIEQNSMLFKHRLTSLPYLDASGVLATDDAAARDLVASARLLLEERNCSWIELRHKHNPWPDIPCRTDKVTFRLPLQQDANAVWETLKPKVRNHIRKGQKSNLTLRTGGSELLDDFYPIYARRMRDLGSGPHAKSFFGALFEVFGDITTVHMAYLQDETQAGAITLRDGKNLHVQWSAGTDKAKETSANMLLYWAMIEFACAAGLDVFDFGRCTVESGIWTFKRQWGAKENALHWHYLLPEGSSLPPPAGEGRCAKAIRACWRFMPVWACTAIGSRVVRKLA